METRTPSLVVYAQNYADDFVLVRLSQDYNILLGGSFYIVIIHFGDWGATQLQSINTTVSTISLSDSRASVHRDVFHFVHEFSFFEPAHNYRIKNSFRLKKINAFFGAFLFLLFIFAWKVLSCCPIYYVLTCQFPQKTTTILQIDDRAFFHKIPSYNNIKRHMKEIWL